MFSAFPLNFDVYYQVSKLANWSEWQSRAVLTSQFRIQCNSDSFRQEIKVKALGKNYSTSYRHSKSIWTIIGLLGKSKLPFIFSQVGATNLKKLQTPDREIAYLILDYE